MAARKSKHIKALSWAVLPILLAVAALVVYRATHPDRAAHTDDGPARLVVDQIQRVPIDARGRRLGYDSQVVILAHEAGCVSIPVHARFLGESWRMEDARLVFRQGGTEGAARTQGQKPLLFPVTVGDMKGFHFKVYLALGSVPAALGPLTLRGRIFADQTFSFYRDGRPVSSPHSPTRSTPWSFVVGRGSGERT